VRKLGLATVLSGMLLTAAGAAPPADLLPLGATGVSQLNGLTWFDAPMTPAALDRFYRAALPRHGFTPAMDVRSGGTLSFYFSGGKGGSVVFTPKGAKTGVMLTLLR
jgi:hypothetical protein